MMNMTIMMTVPYLTNAGGISPNVHLTFSE